MPRNATHFILGGVLPVNPYSPPRAEVELLPEEGVAVRKDGLIGVPRACSLLPICATCGATEGVQHFRMKLKPDVLMRWRGFPRELPIPQCGPCVRRWRVGAWLERSVAFTPLCWIASARLGHLPLAVLFVIAGPVAFLAGQEMIVLRIAKVDARRVWLKGVHESAAAVYCGEIPDVDFG